MMPFPSLIAAGASAAFISDLSDGDCGWEGGPAGNRAALLRSNGLAPERLVAARQCHGDSILAVRAEDAGCGAECREGAIGDADGLMTDCEGVPLGITVADCVPVLFVAPNAVAVVHAGREGTFLNIAGKMVAALHGAYGTPPSTLHAVIGPSAGPCCYEVSEEIRENWVQNGMAAIGSHLDLWETNRQQLCAAGMHNNRIVVAKHCTICQPGYYSYRGQATKCRNLAIITR